MKKKNSPVRRTPALKSQTAAKPVDAVKPVEVVLPVAAKPVEAAKPEASKPVEAAKPVAGPVVAAVSTPSVAAMAAATPAAPVAAKAPPVAAAFPTETVEQLQNPSVEVAVDAAESLGKSGDVRVVPALVSVLENGDGYCHVVTRAAAAMALGKLDDAKTVAALIVAARDEMAEVSCEAILSLGQLKAVSAAPALIDIAGNASGFYLNVSRHAAVRSLGRMKAAAAKPVLSAIAESTYEDAALVSAAREALGQI